MNKIDVVLINQQINEFKNTSTPNAISGEGIALLKDYTEGTTGSGTPKYTGVICNKKDVSFQVWNSLPAFTFLKTTQIAKNETVVKISYNIGKFGLVINRIELAEEQNIDEFIEKKYDIPEMKNEFKEAIEASGATEKAQNIINKILNIGCNTDIEDRIYNEYAAMYYHDNCPTGLLAHTTKCIQIYNGIRKSYTLFKDLKTNDLMVIALAIHDIGKIFEMHNGVYQKYSFVTHRGLGMEYFLSFKNDIIEAYDEEFFYMLYSVIQQHHDEYGEGARTIYAYLVHMIDNMDATVTSIDTYIQDGSYKTEDSGTTIKYNGKTLNILKQ